MDNNTEKRHRGTNFSETETDLLISLVEKYRSIIENKRSDAVSRKEKDRVWEKIAIEYAALSNIKRTIVELKNKYENIKRQLKKKITDNKVEILKTGGGTAHYKPLTESEECLQSMLNISVAGLDSNGDSDLSPTATNIEPQPSTSTCNEVETIKIVVDDAEESSSQIWQTWSPKLLQTPKSTQLMSPQNSKKTRRGTISATNVNSKFNELAEAKLELVALQKQFLQSEEKRKGEYDNLKLEKLKTEIEFFKKKEELEVEIKKAQLLLLQKQLK